MFPVHTPIIRSIRIWVAAYVFLHRVFGWVVVLGAAAPQTRPTQRLSRPPLIQKLGAENHMLQLNVWCSWWWAYAPETCRAKNSLIKLPCCIKLAFQIISSICCLGCTKLGNLNIVVNVVSALRARMPKISLSIPTGGRDTVPVQGVQPSSGYHQTSNPKCTERKNFASCFTEML